MVIGKTECWSLVKNRMLTTSKKKIILNRQMKSEFLFIIYGIAVFFIFYFIFNQKSTTVIYDIPTNLSTQWAWTVPYNHWSYWGGGYGGGHGGLHGGGLHGGGHGLHGDGHGGGHGLHGLHSSR